MLSYRKLLNIAWTAHRTNASVLEELEVRRTLQRDIRQRKLRFFDHVVRAENFSTHILQGRVDGTRSRGRPRRRWIDDVREWTGLAMAACTGIARCRNAWRLLVLDVTTVPHPQT